MADDHGQPKDIPPEVRWIADGLDKPGKSKGGLAKAMHKSPSVVTALLSGARDLKVREIPLIAAYLEVDPPTVDAPGPYDDDAPTLANLNVIGEVAGGVWLEVETEAFDVYSVAVPLDPRFSPAAQFLLKVRGASINRRAANGSLVRCVSVFDAPRNPKDGDWVVVRRVRHGSVETTVKRLRIDPIEGKLLLPDSTDPAFQAPLRLDGENGDSIEITAFVLDFISPATEF